MIAAAMQIPRFTPFLFLALLLTIPVSPVLAFEEINTSYFGGVALDGYDAVSYFTQSRAVRATSLTRSNGKARSGCFRATPTASVSQTIPRPLHPSMVVTAQIR